MLKRIVIAIRQVQLDHEEKSEIVNRNTNNDFGFKTYAALSLDIFRI